MNSQNIYVEVILPLPVEGSFTYSIPKSELEISVGQRVVVQFGTRKLYTAIVINVHTTKPTLYEAKDILAVLEETNVVNPIQINFWKWISKYYMSKLGDVMKESVQAAYSYVRANTHTLGIDPAFYKKIDIHVHVPAGAIPKDGPSAGVAMITALVSLITNKPVKDKLGMTGEISLRGNVLPIGGLKEKATAAHRSGLTHILAPAQNEKDLVDIPKKVLKDLKISFVKDVSEVLKLSLGIDIKNPSKPSKRTAAITAEA